MKNENMRISILWGRHWSCVCPPPISVWSCIDWGDKRDKTWWPRIRSQLNISNHQPTQDNTICGFLGLFVDMTSPIGGRVSFLYLKLQSSANMHRYYYFSDTNRSCNSAIHAICIFVIETGTNLSFIILWYYPVSLSQKHRKCNVMSWNVPCVATPRIFRLFKVITTNTNYTNLVVFSRKIILSN